MCGVDTGGTADDRELKAPGFEIFIAVLTVLSLVNIVLVYAVEDEVLTNVLLVLNGVLSIVFVLDFLYRLATAPSRRDYFWRQLGWADLLASLPFTQLKALRIFRLVRVVRLLRRHGLRSIVRGLVDDKAGSALLTMVLMGILVLEFGSFGMLALEKDADGSNITTASDGVWYVVVTMATVGYGDTFPVTNAGRILGAIIIVIGIGIFGTLTGYLANLFLSPRRATVVGSGDARAQVAELRDLVARQQEALDRMEQLLDADGRRDG